MLAAVDCVDEELDDLFSSEEFELSHTAQDFDYLFSIKASEDSECNTSFPLLNMC